MIDYTIFYKSELPIDKDWPEEANWDIFISAYNSSDRVNKVYNQVKAATKHWLILPDYKFEDGQIPSKDTFIFSDKNEGEFIRNYFNDANIQEIQNQKICIDITGFIKPYMMFILRWLKHLGVTKVDILYSEPGHYAKKEKTTFSDGPVEEIRQVAGYAGLHRQNTTNENSNDLLILGSGYDDELIAQVAEQKSNAKKVQLFGLPSLRPDMYQENILRAHKAAESVGGDIRNDRRSYFAPANDPFVTAAVLRDIFERESSRSPLTNVYLSPLATKPQALGFTLFYLAECIDEPVSMIYPFCNSHAQETSIGISRIWKYDVELI